MLNIMLIKHTIELSIDLIYGGKVMGIENINEYRFFRVTEDVILREIPLKKGDILPITDWELKNLAFSHQGMDLDEKKKMYSKWQEGVLANGTRYFRLKEGTDYEKFIYDNNGRRKKRISDPDVSIEAVRDSDGRVVLKVKPKNPLDVLFTAVMDRELSVIGDKLTTEEATHYQLKDASEKQRQNEESCKARAKKEGINYFSLKMKAELAERCAREYLEQSDLQRKACNYYDKHKAKYYRYVRIVPWLSVEGFYLLENTKVKNNEEIKRIYVQEKEALRSSTLSMFKKILQKTDKEYTK